MTSDGNTRRDFVTKILIARNICKNIFRELVSLWKALFKRIRVPIDVSFVP